MLGTSHCEDQAEKAKSDQRFNANPFKSCRAKVYEIHCYVRFFFLRFVFVASVNFVRLIFSRTTQFFSGPALIYFPVGLFLHRPSWFLLRQIFENLHCALQHPGRLCYRYMRRKNDVHIFSGFCQTSTQGRFCVGRSQTNQAKTWVNV